MCYLLVQYDIGSLIWAIWDGPVFADLGITLGLYLSYSCFRLLYLALAYYFMRVSNTHSLVVNLGYITYVSFGAGHIICPLLIDSILAVISLSVCKIYCIHNSLFSFSGFYMCLLPLTTNSLHYL